MSTLGRELDVNPRRLERAFRDILGVSPYQYFLRVRLNAARSELRRSKRRWTVAEVAANHGFYHPSDFAHHYRRLFDENPGETRRAG